MVDMHGWFWPAVSLLFAGLWLWELLRRHRVEPEEPPSTRKLADQPVEVEDALKAVYALEERTTEPWGPEEVATAIGVPDALAGEMMRALGAFGWARADAEGRWCLTAEGTRRARELVRAHRLWERYLVDREGTPLEKAHAEAERREHQTTLDELDRLDEGLGYPAWDPHGHAIPAPGHDTPPLAARSLLDEAAPGVRFHVVCLDDKSAPLLAQLVAMGLEPGVAGQVLDRGEDVLRLQLGEETILLANAAAEHVFVVPAPVLPIPLGELPVGSRGRVAEVRGGGKHQRRMLDMGIVPGAEVTVVRTASLGDPVEYRVKGSAIAMRRADANTVMVEELTNG